MHTVKVVVASLNPVKIEAVEDAFKRQYPNADLELIPISVESSVSNQPMSDEETLRGARIRVLNARSARPGADFWVGVEGGLDTYDGALMAFAWMAVQGRLGEISEARSPTLPLPPAVQQLVEGGLELGEANDRVFSTLNSKHRGGAFGLLTDGLYTRKHIYTQTLIFALIPFVHDLWR